MTTSKRERHPLLVVGDSGVSALIETVVPDETVELRTIAETIVHLGVHEAAGCVLTGDALGEHGDGGIRALRQADPTLPLMLLSNTDGTKSEQVALRSGLDAVLDPLGATPSPTALAQRRRALRPGTGAVAPRRILVCDADDDSRELVNRTLVRAGFEVVEARTGFQALRRQRERHCPVLVTDMVLRDLDGCETIEAARRYDPWVVPIVLTGFPTLDALPASDLEFLVRPFGTDALVRAVLGAFERWSAAADEPRLARSPVIKALLLSRDWARAQRIIDLLATSDAPRFEVAWSERVDAVGDQIRSTGFDVIVADLDTSEEHAAEICAKLQFERGELPVVAVTSGDDGRSSDKAVACGAEAWLSADHLSAEALVQRLRYVLSQQRAQAENGLSRSAASLRSAIADNADSILIVDGGGVIRFANPASTELFGAGREALVGTPFGHPIVPELTTDIQIDGGKGVRVVEMRACATDWTGRPAWVVSLRDATDQRMAEARLRELGNQLQRANRQIEALAYNDPLTRLANRRGLERRLAAELSRVRRTGAGLVAVLVDCDEFKTVNDKLGHDVGDAVLVQIADTLADAVRPTDHVARVGGDEFIVLLPGARIAEAMRAAERMRANIAENPIVVGGEPLAVTVSLGVAPVPIQTENIGEVVAATTAALKRSKLAGRNRVSLETARGPEVWRRHASGLFEQLTDRRCFSAVSQPIRRLANRRVVAYEMLARTNIESLGMPGDFFRVARQRGLLTTVDLHCLRTCLAAAPASSRAHVNLLPTTILQTPVERLIELLPARTEGLCVELSEQQLVGDPGELRVRLRRLREAGVTIALDDVGFGRSSLEALILLEPDVVKIDRRYVHGVADRRDGRRILDRLLGAVRALGAATTAEGIEREEDLDILVDLGVETGQGFLLGRPGAA